MHMPSEQDQAWLVPALYDCAIHVSEGSFQKTEDSLSKIKQFSSIVDGPLQRLSQIMAYSLARRLLLSIKGLSGALIHPSDYFEQSSIQSARSSFASLSPYLCTGSAAMNQAIFEALEGEKVVRIIDLSCSASNPYQWLKLLHDFHGRTGGPPEVRLTVVHDDNDFLASMKASLSNEAHMLKISFQFNQVNGRLETLDFNNLHDVLGIKYGEAIAISCCLQMHRLLVDDDNVTCPPIDQLQKMANDAKQMASSIYSPPSTLNYPETPSPGCLASFLNAIRSLKPNIMLVMEQDANHNALLFYERFGEALKYYAALFDSFNAVAAANSQRAHERARVERMILGEEIKNILLCEGANRRERHERLSQWAKYMDASGFHHVPLSFRAIWEAQLKLTSFGLNGCHYRVENECLLLGWGSTRLYSISAWRPKKGSTSGSREQMLVQRQTVWPYS